MKWYSWVILIFFTIIAALIIRWLIITYPLSLDRDWLSFLADFGKSMGSIALLGLVFQVVWRSIDDKEQVKPQIEVLGVEYVTIDDVNNVSGVFTHVELSEDDLPDEIEYAEYRKYYGAIRPDGNKFMKVSLKNLKSGPGATAYRVRIRIRVRLTKYPKGKVANSKEMICPQQPGLDIRPGMEEHLYVNCTSANPNMRHIKFDVIGIECYNINDKRYSHKSLKFKPFSAPIQDLT